MKKITREQTKEFIQKNTLYILALIGIGIGMILAIDYNDKLPRAISPAVPYLDLSDTEKKLESQQDTLKKSIAIVDEQNTKLEQDAKGKNYNFPDLVSQNDALKLQSGLTDINGEGVLIVLDDSVSRKASPNAIAHASDLRDLVDLLWARGATSISIKGDGSTDERIGPSTSIDCIVNTVLINGIKMVPPFEVRAIGKRDSLVAAINDRIALKDIYDRMDSEGLKFSLNDSVETVNIAKFTGNFITDHVKVK
jgi:uncharacterized protein YlxW (UPF0749 family)